MKLSKYRAVEGDHEHDFATWVRELRKKSGVYVFKERGFLGTSGRVVYVGESHTGRLYETLTRHFQSRKNADPQSLSSYGRDEVLVAVKVCEPANAVIAQDSMICALRPRDNRQFPCGDAPPETDSSFNFGANEEEEY